MKKERAAMSVLDDMIVNAKSAADAVGKTASKLVDISKLRISAADLNAEINKKYEALGRAVYEARKSGRRFRTGSRREHHGD